MKQLYCIVIILCTLFVGCKDDKLSSFDFSYHIQIINVYSVKYHVDSNGNYTKEKSNPFIVRTGKPQIETGKLDSKHLRQLKGLLRDARIDQENENYGFADGNDSDIYLQITLKDKQGTHYINIKGRDMKHIRSGIVNLLQNIDNVLP